MKKDFSVHELETLTDNEILQSILNEELEFLSEREIKSSLFLTRLNDIKKKIDRKVKIESYP